MKKYWIRSSVFNVTFYVTSAVYCIVLSPSLLMPRPVYSKITDFWVTTVAFLERAIMGLHYEVIGAENLPKDGAYIIAAKHQSAYETFKLRLLFKEPAIVLKKELLSIPLWGPYLKKYGVIAIDRSTPEQALRSLQEGAVKMKEEGRPIVIFPQGTRVKVGVKAPYKPGIARVQEITKLPIIPMALNSGVFCPRGGWLKQPGTVTFKLLKPIPPGKDRTTLMSELEDKLEKESATLAAKAKTLKHTKGPMVRGGVAWAFFALSMFAVYTMWWGLAANMIKQEYLKLNQFRDSLVSLEPLEIKGFPMMTITRKEETLKTTDGDLTLKDVYIHGWPLPGIPMQILTNEISIASFRWLQPVKLDGFEGYFSYWPNKVTIKDSSLKKDDFIGKVIGSVDLNQQPIPLVDATVTFKNQQTLLTYLASIGVIDERSAMFMAGGFGVLADKDGVVSVPVSQRGNTLYAGPFAFAEIPEQKPIIAGSSVEETGDLQVPSP